MGLQRETVLDGVADELHRFSGLVRSLDDDELDAATRCEGWAVRDVAGHVVGTVVDVTAGRLDGQGTPLVTERQAAERRGRSGEELADELEAALPALTDAISSLPPELWDGPSPTDPTFTLGFAATSSVARETNVYRYELR